VGGVVESILSLHGGAALALLFMFTALEAPAFIGLVLPGELGLVLGGVLAHSGRISLAAAMVVGIGGAIAGDSAGYWLGRRWRHLLLASPIGRRVKPAQLRRAEAILNRRSAVTLSVGRLTAGARVLLPGLAGASGIPYRTFLVWNALAGAVWATAHLMLGYAAGESWRRIHQLAGRFALYLLLATALLAAVVLGIRLLRGHRIAQSGEAAHLRDASAGSEDSDDDRHARTG
jgi:membrane protein DedA with SNARE-associated domain